MTSDAKSRRAWASNEFKRLLALARSFGVNRRALAILSVLEQLEGMALIDVQHLAQSIDRTLGREAKRKSLSPFRVRHGLAEGIVFRAFRNDVFIGKSDS